MSPFQLSLPLPTAPAPVPADCPYLCQLIRRYNRAVTETPIAVVIPALNEAERLGDCLDSVGAGAAEVVVVDGGSTDATVQVAEERPTARVLHSPQGRGLQLNRGARATWAPMLLFLHADCRLPEGWDAAVREALEDPKVALSCFRLHTEPSRQGAGGVRRAWLRCLDLRSLGFGLPYGDQAFAVRREVFEVVGGFREIPLMEDLAFARECRRLGRIRVLPLEVRTTARRFESRPIAARLCTASFPLLFRLGVSPRRLARWYRDVR